MIEDDIPEYIEVKGKKIPINKDGYRRWALGAGTRVLHFSQAEPLKIILDDQLVGTLDLKEFIEIDPDGQGTTIRLGTTGPKIKDNLVGLGGNYLDPYLLGAKDTQQVIEAWNWLFEQMDIDKRKFEMFLEFVYIMDFLSTGNAKETIFRIMSVAIDLKELDRMGVNTKSKISELVEKIKGNMRAFKKHEKNQKSLALFQISLLTYALSDLFAESRLARFAKSVDYDVKVNRSPDLLINDVRVEVKFDRRDELNEKRFLNKISKGLTQKADLIAIFTNPQKIDTNEMKLTWFPLETLDKSLKMGIETCKNGKRKCILLYTTTNKGLLGKLAIIR